MPGNSVAGNALSDSPNRGFDGLNPSDVGISSLLKSFFRKLTDHLVTSEMYGSLIEASKTEPEQAHFNSIKRLMDATSLRESQAGSQRLDFAWLQIGYLNRDEISGVN